MSILPVRSNIDQLRRQAKDLLRAARSGDAAAVDRIRAVAESLTLTAARLAIAREHGFTSWAALKDEVRARTADLDATVLAFCEASIRDWTGRAVRMLDEHPEIADSALPAAVVLGDVARVRAAIAEDPAAATRPDARSGWTSLHLACASRWHRLDPARAEGLVAVTRLLLDAGADPSAETVGQRGGWTPLRCAVAGVANPAIVRLLLNRGAVPDDHDLYLACFGEDDHESLRLLLDRAPNVAETTALAAPISTGDVEGVRLLLEAGANPNQPTPAELYGTGHDDEPPRPAIYAAIRCDCPTELVRLLLEAGADPSAPGPEGHLPHQMAARRGRADVARLLGRYGAVPSATEVDLLLSACLQGDRATAERQLSRGRVRVDQLRAEDYAALVRAAEAGSTASVELMLDLGFPVTACGDDGGTALHAAAYNGSAATAQLLLERGAELDAHDTTWHDTALGWALVGSGERPARNPHPDWINTVQALIAAGASLTGVTLSPDDPKPPSPQVAQLLRAHGITDQPAPAP